MRKTNLLTVIIAILFALLSVQDRVTTAAATSSLATLAASMQPGTWATLATNNINETLGPTFQTGSSFNILAEGPDMVWDPITQQVFFFGSDHRDLSQFVSYTASTNTWQRLPRAAWMPTEADYNYGMMHGEDHSAVDQERGIYYIREFGLYNRDIHRYNTQTRTWSDLPPFGLSNDYIESTVGVEFFPDIRSLFVVNGGGGVAKYNNVFLFSEDTQTWTTVPIGQTGPGNSQRTFAKYNPVHKVMVFIVAGYGDHRVFKMDASRRVTQLRDAPIGLGIMCPCDGPSVHFLADPVTGDYLVIEKDTKALWRYDVVTDTWTKLSTVIPPSVFTKSFDTSVANPIFSVAAATINDLGVQMFVSCDHVTSNGLHAASCRVNLFKYAATAAQPPDTTAPSLSAIGVNGISSAGGTIGWTTNEAADTQVEYGTSTAYGSQSTLNASMVTAHSQALSGLAPSTTYNYRVKSRDAAGNLAVSPNATFVTSAVAAADTTPPSVSISSPTAGSSASATVTITASASDNVGVAGVLFKMDGSTVGAEDTVAPFSVSWNTTSASNASHVLTAVARDAAGNQTTSASVTVNVNNAPVSGGDFAARCAAAGVVRCVGFDQAADIAGGYGSNSGIFSGASTPQLDAAMKASGNSSLKFTVPSNSPADTSGSYFTNFSSDLATQFGQGDEFFVQWRQRFSPEFLSTVYQGGGGWKQAIIGEGDRPGSPFVASCTQLEMVTQNTNTRGFAQNYHSCGGKDGHYEPLNEQYGSYDYKLQNNRPAPYCLYSQSSTGYFPPNGNCVGYVPNEWMTFQVHIKIGTWYLNDGNYHRDSTVELWIGREGQPSQKVNSFTTYDIANTNPLAKYGKIWLLPYNTGKSSSQAHPTAYIWYDDLIISRNFIPDPSNVADTTAPVLSGLNATSITTAAAVINWTSNEASDTQVEYGPTTAYGSQTSINASLVTAHSQALSGLNAGTLYNYRVKSRDAAGNLAVSANATFTTAAPPDVTPPVLSAVAASGISASGANVSWTTNEASDTQVEFGLTTAYGSSSALNSALVTAHAATLSGLAGNTTYHFRVKSKDAAGNLAVGSDATFTTLDVVAPVLSAVAASGISASGANVSWTTDEASDTQVEFGLTTAYGSSSALNSALVTAHAATLSGLAGNTTYHFRVKSKDAAGNLAVGSDATFTTLDVVAPVISGVAASGISTSSASIAWTTDEASSSQIEFGTSSSYGQLSPLDGALVTAHSAVLSGLTAGTSYNFRVLSRDAAGNLATSPNFTFTTVAPFDFSLSLASNGTISTGGYVSYAVDTAVVSGLGETVNLSASGMPSGVTASFTPACTPACTSTLTFWASNSAPAGTFPILVTGAAGAVSHSATLSLTVVASGPRTIHIYPGTNVFSSAAQGLAAGDTLIVHQGVYSETNRMSLRVAGTAAAPVVIKNAAGESTPLITRPAAAAIQNTINIEGSASYLTIQGLEIAGNGGDGVNMSGLLSYITLEDLVIHDVDVAINFRASMHHITVRHNHIFNTGINGGTGEGLYVGCNDATCVVDNSLIERNWIHDTLPGTTQGDGIEVKVGSHSNIVRDNVVYNRPYPGILVYGTGGNPANVVEGNVVWNASEGIYAIADAIVRNNIVFNSGTGLSLYGHAQVPQMKNVLAVNNTLYNNNDAIYMRWSSSAVNMVLANNAIYSPGKNALNLTGSVGTFVANYVEGGSDRALNATEFINGGTAANAFIDPVNADFWLKAGSPLIGKGNNINAAVVDFNGVARLSPQDVGAYESDGWATNPGWKVTPGFKVVSVLVPPADTLPPVISNVNVSNVTASGAVITWSTDELSNSQVEFGVSLSYGSQTALDSQSVTAHSQALSGLQPGTLYNYRVKSRDAAGNLAVSSNLTFTTAVSQPPVDTTLVAYWKFDEGAGTATVDSSGNNNTGTLVRGPVWTSGIVGKALQFNASDNGNDNDDPQVLIGRAFDVAALPFTFTAWVNPVNFSDYRAILSKRDRANPSSMRFDIGLAKNTGRIYVQTSRNVVTFNVAPAVNTWSHIAVVATATDTKVYVNGVLKQTMSAVQLGSSATANTVIGGTGEGTGGDNDPFRGMLDEIRVYKRALTAAEVQGVYTSR